MLLRRVAAADDGSGAGVGRPRLFAVPRLLVGLGAGAPRCGGATPDCDSPTAARSPTSPLDLRPPFAALGGGGGSLLRSPRSPRARSWDSHRLGLGGLVDDALALAEPAAGGASRNPLLGLGGLVDDALALAEPAAGGASRNPLLGLGAAQARQQPFKLLPQCLATRPRDCAHASPVLGNVGTAVASYKPVPCSRSYGDVKSGPEGVTVPGAAAPPGASSHPADLGKFPAAGSLPASIGGGPRRYVGSVSATEVEQSEDYTCIIAHGPNPKTTRIFGDCILEPCTLGDGVDAMEVKEGAESYWLVKCFDDGEPGEEFLSSCVSCKKKLDGNDSCIYRYVDAISTTFFCDDSENPN